MKLSLRKFLYAAAVVLAGMRTGQAEEIRLAPTFDPFAQQASATTLFTGPEISLVGHNGCDEATCGQPDCGNQSNACCGTQRHVGRDFMVCQERGCDWYATIEFLLLRPYAGAGFLNPGNTNPAQLGFEPSYRFVAGRQLSDGLGARIRYFTYDQSNNFGGGLVSIETRHYDAELTQAVDFRKWGFLFSGGLRYLEFDADAGIGATLNRIGFDGVGLTTSAQASRQMRMNGMRMVATARWSALYGNSKANTIAGTAAPAALTPQNDDLVNMLELSIGPQYTRQLRNATLVIGGGLEAQYYSNITNIVANPTALDGAADFGFAGFTGGITLMR